MPEQPKAEVPSKTKLKLVWPDFNADAENHERTADWGFSDQAGQEFAQERNARYVREGY